MTTTTVINPATAVIPDGFFGCVSRASAERVLDGVRTGYERDLAAAQTRIEEMRRMMATAVTTELTARDQVARIIGSSGEGATTSVVNSEEGTIQIDFPDKLTTATVNIFTNRTTIGASEGAAWGERLGPITFQPNLSGVVSDDDAGRLDMWLLRADKARAGEDISMAPATLYAATAPVDGVVISVAPGSNGQPAEA